MSSFNPAGGAGISSVPPATRTCAAIIMVLALTILFGWAAGQDALRFMFFSDVAVRPNTAIGLGLAAAALALPARPSRFAAAIVLLIGGLTLIEYLTALDFGIDSAGFSAAPSEAGQRFPFRMAPETAVALLLTALALIASHGGARVRKAGQIAALLTTWLASLALVASAYDAHIFPALRPLTPMASVTAMLFLVWAVGFFARTIDEGPASIFARRDRWGDAVRRIGVAALLMPFFFGLICVLLVERRWIDANYALAGTITATTLTLLYTIANYTSRVREEDSRRGVAEAVTRRTEALYRTIVETSLEGICISDASGRLTFVNNRFAEMLGEARAELIGRNLFDFIVDVESTESFRDAPLGAQQEVRMRGASGRTIDVLCSSTAFHSDDGSFDGVVAMLVDTTERQAARRALQQAHDVLRQRVQSLEGTASEEMQRAQDRIEVHQARIEDLAARLTTAHLELEAFSYSVSHDLRAPLRTIDGFGRELLRSQQLDERGRIFVQRIQAGAQRMSALIDALLDLSRVSHASVQRTHVDLTALATSVARDLRERTTSNVVIDVAPGLHVHADASLVRIALENLIGNAIKFSSRQEQPRIEIGSDRGALFVRDNGIGFDPALAERLFSPFERLQNEYEGSGIGLAIVHRIIRRHGGSIRAASRPGEGATISFTLGDAAHTNGEAA